MYWHDLLVWSRPLHATRHTALKTLNRTSPARIDAAAAQNYTLRERVIYRQLGSYNVYIICDYAVLYLVTYAVFGFSDGAKIIGANKTMR